DGARIMFDLAGAPSGLPEQLEVFTTRPDTIFGMSFCAIAPDHPLAAALAEKNPALAGFIRSCQSKGTSEAALETAEKEGFDTGLRARHPFKSGESAPVYVANFVLMGYGTGAIFGCPAHDERDFAFATKYGLPIRPVVVPRDIDPGVFTLDGAAYTGGGVIANSDFLDGKSVEEAKRLVTERLEASGRGARKTGDRVRDRGISPQRHGCSRRA